jgi:hypothetical protein
VTECRLVSGGAGFQPVRAVIARTDPDEQEYFVLL